MKSLNFCMVVVFMCASTGCGETPVKSGEITIADSGVGDTADTGTNETSGTSDNHPVDSDSDGYAPFNANGQVVDCNDSNADVHPGANEICDGVDNDCDGQVDEGYNTVVLYAVIQVSLLKCVLIQMDMLLTILTVMILMQTFTLEQKMLWGTVLIQTVVRMAPKKLRSITI